MENKENTKTDEMKLSGDDIINFFRKIFDAEYSKNIILKDDAGDKVLKANLFIVLIIFFLIPALALISFMLLIATNYSLTMVKKIK